MLKARKCPKIINPEISNYDPANDLALQNKY